MLRHFAAIATLLAVFAVIEGSNSAESAMQGQPAAAAKPLTVAVVEGRVREGPSLNSRILFTVKKGDSLNLLEESGDWRKVALQDGRSGWVHKSLFAEEVQAEKKPSGSGRETRKVLAVSVEVALIREQPRPDARIIYRLKMGAIVSSKRTVNGWHEIPLPDGRTGWAQKELFKDN